jgi:hypothetical protein
VGEDGDRACGLAEGALLAVEGEPVQPVADRGRESGVRAADLGDPVRVLDDADRFPFGVAVDARRMACDPAGLGREKLLGACLLGVVQAAPAVVGHEHEQDDGDRREHGEPLERPEQPPRARASPGRVRLDLGRDPDLVAADLDQRRLEPLLAAELLDVGLLRSPSPRWPRRAPLSQPGQEEVRLQREEGEERKPGRNPAPQLG